jgi:hypothetical protein
VTFGAKRGRACAYISFSTATHVGFAIALHQNSLRRMRSLMPAQGSYPGDRGHYGDELCRSWPTLSELSVSEARFSPGYEPWAAIGERLRRTSFENALHATFCATALPMCNAAPDSEYVIESRLGCL